MFSQKGNIVNLNNLRSTGSKHGVLKWIQIRIAINKLPIMTQKSLFRSEDVSPQAHLFEMARSQGYLTYDQILSVWPEPEGELEQLDRLFGALLAANIPFGDKGSLRPGSKNKGLDL
jgi:hypothetical protein